MKSTIKWIGVALMAAAVFSFTACDSGNGPGTSGPEQLAKPSGLLINGTNLIWNPVTGASGYMVAIDSIEYNTQQNSFSLSILSDYKQYTLKVKAKSDGTAYTDSEWSVTVPYNLEEPEGIPALDTPDNLQISGTKLSWNSVEGAVRYSVVIDGTANEASGTSYSLSGLTATGTYTIKVRAIGNNVDYKHSAWSVAISYTVQEPTRGLEFTLTSGGTGYSVSRGTATAADVVIPPTYNGLPVIYVDYRGFENYTAMTSIIIPDSIRLISISAFRGCSSLTSITIPFVGDLAYESENASTHFGIIFGASKYNDQEYYIPQSLKTVIITGGNSIGSCAFYYCSGLTSITIPDSVTSIGGSAFEYCRSLESITIPDSVESIGNSAFRGCSSLTSITIPFVGGSRTATTYSAVFGYIFGYTTTKDSSPPYGATYQFYDENATSPYYHYYIPTSLRTVTITGGDSIGERAFYGCNRLKSITIPDSVTSIGGSAFRGCYSLTSITIPDSVTSIGGGAFWSCSSLESITIPDSVASIGVSTFSDCSDLRSITIPDSVTSIGGYAFDYCINLMSIVIPDSVESIGSNAFRRCSSLTSVFYGGADYSAWMGISIGDELNLASATRYYYSETQPTESGNFWRFIDGEPTVW